MGQVVSKARAEGGPRRALVRPRQAVQRPLVRRLGDRVGQGDRQVRRRGGVERRSVYRSSRTYPPPQLEPRDPQRRLLQQVAHACLRQLEAQL